MEKKLIMGKVVSTIGDLNYAGLSEQCTYYTRRIF